MNYIELINNFWDMDITWQFNCCETRLYFYLVKTANSLGWLDNWTHSDARTAANVGVSVNSMKTARNRLVQANLIEVKIGGKYHGDKTRYQILIPNPQPNLYPNPQPNPQPNHTPLTKRKLNIKSICVSACEEEKKITPLKIEENESPPVAPPPPFVVNGFMPDVKDIEQELPNMELNRTKEFVFLKKRIQIEDTKVLDEWRAFKLNNFTGSVYKESWNAVYKWFRDSLLYSINNTSNGKRITDSSNKGNSNGRNGGLQILTGNLKEQLANIAAGGEEDTLFEI